MHIILTCVFLWKGLTEEENILLPLLENITSNGIYFSFIVQGEMDLWIQKVNSVTGAEGTSVPSKSMTLPARVEGEKEGKKKKAGFLTLKKKQNYTTNLGLFSIEQLNLGERLAEMEVLDYRLNFLKVLKGDVVLKTGVFNLFVLTFLYTLFIQGKIFLNRLH